MGAQRQQLQQQNPAGAATVLRRLTLGEKKKNFRRSGSPGVRPLEVYAKGLERDRPSSWAWASAIGVLLESAAEAQGAGGIVRLRRLRGSVAAATVSQSGLLRGLRRFRLRR